MDIKKSDSRTKRFIEQYGATAYELDALHPEQLKRIVEESIQAFTDMDAIEEDLEAEKEDWEILNYYKNRVYEVLSG